MNRDDFFEPDEHEHHSPHRTREMTYYAHLLLRRLWLIAVIAAVVGVNGYLWVSRQPDVYTSTAVIQVEQQEQKVLKTDDVQSTRMDSADYLKTIQGTLANRTLLYEVAKTLGMDKGSQNPSSELALSNALAGQVSVKIRPGSRLLDVSATSQDPEQAQQIVATLLESFLRQNYNQSFGLTKVANEFLEKEAEKLKEKLQASERKLQDYREKHQAISLEDNQNIIVDKLKDLNAQVGAAQQTRLRLEADIDQLGSVAAGDTEAMLAINSVATLPQVSAQTQQLVSAEAALAALKQRYKEKHPKYIQAVTQIAQLKESVQNTLRNASSLLRLQYEAAKQTEQKLADALQEQEKQALELSKIAIPYNVLAREVESDRAMYDSVISRLRETSISQGIEKNPFRIVEEPMVPNHPSGPNRKKIILMALALGLGLGAAVVLGLDFLDSSIHSVDQAERLLNLPALAAMPDAKNLAKPVVMYEGGGSPQAEAFRTLRTSLSLLGDEDRRRVILFTSAIPAEGKSFTSVNCAVALSQQKFRTLLIDADLRRPRIEELVYGDKTGRAGLSNYMSDHCPLEKAIHATDHDNLAVMPAGERAPNPAELLASGSFPKTLAAVLEKYDRIVIDTAPVNAVSDTLALARHVHLVCLVVRANKTPAKAVARAADLLKKSGARMAGFVLNRLPKGFGAGYYYYYYGDQYAKDSVYGDADTKKN